MNAGPKPLTRQLSEWQQFKVSDGLDSVIRQLGVMDCARWFKRNVSDGTLAVCVAIEPEIGWHLSISFRNHRGELTRYPTWDEIADARYRLLPDDLDFVMHLPPPGQYVALHDTTFHLHQHPEPGGHL